MKKIKNVLKIFVLFSLVIAALSIPKAVDASAKELKYQTVKKDYSKDFVGTNGTISTISYASRVKFSGDSAAIKKINKALYKLSKELTPTAINAYAKDAAEGGACSDTYEDYMEMDVVYDKGKYVSVTSFMNWYAGGVGNLFLRGYTYNKENGKRVYITKATGLSLKKIKKILINKINETDEFEGCNIEDVINNKKASEFSFYFTGENSIAVTFEPYELGWGGRYREYSIDF